MSETTVQFEDHTVHAGGVQLHYHEVGQGETLFLVPPGWGVGSSYLQKSFSSLSDEHRLVFIDTRGSGLSSRPVNEDEMSSVTMADDLEALRIHLGVDQINLLGHSNSGAIALAYAAKYPHRVKRLVVIGSQVLGLSGAAETMAILQRRAGDPRFDTAVQAVSQFFSGAVDSSRSDEALTDFIAQVLPLYLHSPETFLPEASEKLSGPISSYAFRAQNAADRSAGTDQIPSLANIRAKTLIMGGREDFICPVGLSQRVHEEIGVSSLSVFEESGHFPWIEEPEPFFQQLHSFLLS